MKHLLEVCLIVISLTASNTQPAVAQSAPGNEAPHLQKGISVDLPRTTSAVSIPEADTNDALVVTIRRDGSTYLGTDPISIAELPENLKDALSRQADRSVYLKADGHAPYASVIRVLDSLHCGGIEAVTLLTTQSGATTPGTLMRPEGLPLQIVAPLGESKRTYLY